MSRIVPYENAILFANKQTIEDQDVEVSRAFVLPPPPQAKRPPFKRNKPLNKLGSSPTENSLEESDFFEETLNARGYSS